MAAQIQSALTILRRKQVEARTGLSRSTIYERIKAGTFRAPLALGTRAVGWDSSLIEAWIVDHLRNGPAERKARKSPAR
jgi:prophage regulatory protein